MKNSSSDNKNSWINTVLDDPLYFRVVGSGVSPWVGKKNFLSTKSVQGTKIITIESEIEYTNRPSRANMQPKEGRIAFAKMKDTFKVLVANEELSKNYILSTGFTLIEPKIDSNYVYQYFQTESFNLQKNRYSEGSTQQAISQGDFNKLVISFPKDKLEQNKIAEILSTLDKVIESTNTIIEKYCQIKNGLMQDLFKYGLDENGKIRSEKTHKFKNSPLGRIPNEWEVLKFSDLADAIDPQPDHRAPKEVVDGYPYVGVGDFVNGEIDFNRCRKISLEALKKQNNRFTIENGDILFGKIGTIGEPKILSKTDTSFALNANTILIKPKENNTFVFWLLNSGAILKLINDQTNQTSQPAFGILKIRILECSAPKASRERAAISRCLDEMNNTILKELLYKTKLLNMKQGLMEDLMKGKVMVTNQLKK